MLEASTLVLLPSPLDEDVAGAPEDVAWLEEVTPLDDELPDVIDPLEDAEPLDEAGLPDVIDPLEDAEPLDEAELLADVLPPVELEDPAEEPVPVAPEELLAELALENDALDVEPGWSVPPDAPDPVPPGPVQAPRSNVYAIGRRSARIRMSSLVGGPRTVSGRGITGQPIGGVRNSTTSFLSMPQPGCQPCRGRLRAFCTPSTAHASPVAGPGRMLRNRSARRVVGAPCASVTRDGFCGGAERSGRSM
ncbi:MAG: hypothetical protein AB2A00_29715 [Myxococcota bacterium]